MSRAGDDDDEPKGVSRRQLLTFWRRPLEQAVKVTRPPPPLTPHERRAPPLRPPGMLHEQLLLKHCLHCGKCVEACPAHAIFPLGEEWGAAAGTPAIDPRRQPCVLCTGLRCTHACPSGALLPVFANEEVAMGTARVEPATCVTFHGRACSACHMVCPQGALTFEEGGQLRVLDDKCVGCGLCERACPTEPQSIRVHPRA
jgi:ferredoxin-type protein NapG